MKRNTVLSSLLLACLAVILSCGGGEADKALADLEAFGPKIVAAVAANDADALRELETGYKRTLVSVVQLLEKEAPTPERKKRLVEIVKALDSLLGSPWR